MYTYTEEEAKNKIARFIAQQFDALSKEHDLFVNLGVGIPTMVADYTTSKRVFLHAENGMLGVGPAVQTEEDKDLLLINAGRINVTETKGCNYMDSVESFGMIRGGHIDATVIGAFEVDEHGDVANWVIPNGKMLGVGGAMDLVAGAKVVYIAMRHLSKNGKSKIVKKCVLPVTGCKVTDYIVTEYAVFHFYKDRLVLEAIDPHITVKELMNITEANFDVSDTLQKITF